jgi:hypothetical protein
MVQDILDIINQVIAWTFLITIIIFQSYVYHKTSFKMDKAAIILMLTYMLVAFHRKVMDFFVHTKDGRALTTDMIEVMGPIAYNISTGLLYFFVFEMKNIKNTL